VSGAPEICLADCSENKYYASSGRSEGARMQAKTHLKLVTPTGKKRAVAPQRRPNSEYRKREHLTPAEVAKLIEAAKGNRYGQRDATMILVAYRHGFRASEIVDLEWSAIDFVRAEMHVRRAKNGKPATHPIRWERTRKSQVATS